MFLLPHVLPRLPYPGALLDSPVASFPILGTLLWLYGRWYRSRHSKLIQWHKTHLLAIDHEYAFHDKLDALVKARIKARAEGIGPRDARYPVLSDLDKQ